VGAAAQMAGVVRRRRSPGATPGRRGALPRRRQQDLKADPWTRSHADPAGSSQTGRAVCARVCGLRDRVAAPATLVRYDNTEVAIRSSTPGNGSVSDGYHGTPSPNTQCSSSKGNVARQARQGREDKMSHTNRRRSP